MVTVFLAISLTLNYIFEQWGPKNGFNRRTLYNKKEQKYNVSCLVVNVMYVGHHDQDNKQQNCNFGTNKIFLVTGKHFFCLVNNKN